MYTRYPVTHEYDYDRRAAAFTTYEHAVRDAARQYGIKQGLQTIFSRALRTARELDEKLQRQAQTVNPEDTWVHNPRLDALWAELDKAFQTLFGFSIRPLP